MILAEGRERKEMPGYLIWILLLFDGWALRGRILYCCVDITVLLASEEAIVYF